MLYIWLVGDGKKINIWTHNWIPALDHPLLSEDELLSHIIQHQLTSTKTHSSMHNNAHWTHPPTNRLKNNIGASFHRKYLFS